ncbi:MAG: hypothetical protein ONB23_06280 [candidate division KSB1 bacterium]|nr:hypothetical protein [candidate division KSB1 bacterium]
MKILERRFTFIHTHFLTDCEKLPAEVGRELQKQMERFLRARGIVYGIHFEERKSEKGLRIVLECIPLPSRLKEIETYLEELVRPIPTRPRPVMPVWVEPPGEAAKPKASEPSATR